MPSKPTSSPSLRDLQQWMRWVITDPRGVEPALADPRPSTRAAQTYPSRYTEPGPRCLKWVSSHAPLPASGRLEIYAEAYFARMAEALNGDFPATRTALGETAFLKLAADYLKAFPSTTPNIGEIGENLPAFIKTHETADGLPWLHELAELEWLVIESFYADDHPRLDPAALTAIAPECWPGARFRLDPSVRFFQPEFAVDEVWHGHSIRAEPQGARIVLFRKADGCVDVRHMERLPFEILRAMSQGASLAEICEQLPGEGEMPPLMKWFSDWVAEGMIVSVHTDQEESNVD